MFSFANKKPYVAITFLLIGLFILVSNSMASDKARSGSFTGMNNHATTGSVAIVKTENGYAIELGADFSFDGAPDPKVALGKNGQYDPATLIEPLRSNSGEQSYSIPVSIDPADYNEVYIWCEKFSVGLGVATIQ